MTTTRPRTLTGVGFGTSFTNLSEKPVIGNNRRFFSKQWAQPVILKTHLNQLIGLVPNFSGSFRQCILSNFCTKCCGLFLGNSLVLLCLLFLKIQNPKSTNLAGSLDGAPIHRHFANSKTKTLSRDRTILQRFIHTTGIRCFLSIHRLQCDCGCDLRARCAAAVRNHNTTTPLRPRRGLTPLGGCHMVASEEQAQKKKFGPRHVLATEA